MARFIESRLQSRGQAPGEPILIGRQKMEKPRITLMDYTENQIIEKELENIEDCLEYVKKKSVSWINIYGLHDMDLIQKIGQMFELNSLLLEDLLNTDHTPKYEYFQSHDCFIVKMLFFSEDNKNIESEQLTIILGESFVLTFQERKGDVFPPLRARIRNKTGKIRQRSNDFLAYAILDIIADNYLIIIEKIGIKVEAIDKMLLENSGKNVTEQIYALKIELSFLRKNIRPFREAIKKLQKSEVTHFSPKYKSYLNDLEDLAEQAADTIELYSNIVTDQLNTFSTIVGNKMNQIMKVLTIFSTTFIPLTFIAGVYGMNFKYLPELNFRFGYAFFWFLVVIISAGFIYYFKKKNWL